VKQRNLQRQQEQQRQLRFLQVRLLATKGMWQALAVRLVGSIGATLAAQAGSRAATVRVEPATVLAQEWPRLAPWIL
jgi:hypothetical protein